MAKIETGKLYIAGASGAVVEVRPENGKKFGLQELQDGVGGYIETLVPKERGSLVYCNEDGGTKRLPANFHTSAVCNMAVYALNGYGVDWKARGNLLVVRKAGAAAEGSKTVKEALRALKAAAK